MIKWDFTMCYIWRRHFAPWFFNRLRLYISSGLTYLLSSAVVNSLNLRCHQCFVASWVC